MRLCWPTRRWSFVSSTNISTFSPHVREHSGDNHSRTSTRYLRQLVLTMASFPHRNTDPHPSSEQLTIAERVWTNDITCLERQYYPFVSNKEKQIIRVPSNELLFHEKTHADKYKGLKSPQSMREPPKTKSFAEIRSSSVGIETNNSYSFAHVSQPAISGCTEAERVGTWLGEIPTVTQEQKNWRSEAVRPVDIDTETKYALQALENPVGVLPASYMLKGLRKKQRGELQWVGGWLVDGWCEQGRGEWSLLGSRGGHQ